MYPITVRGGMIVDRRRTELLRQIQELQFAAVELTLFMDIHPEQRQPLADYNRIAEHLRSLMDEYEKLYGPLMPFGQSTVENRWSWTDEPWPWQL
jgi:spore coat protein JB